MEEKNSFTSYIQPELKSENATYNSKLLRPRLLPKEEIVLDAHGYMLRGVSRNIEKKGLYGSLFVTNFKISFVTSDITQDDDCFQENCFLGRDDITLNSIDVVYLIMDGKRKKIHRKQDINSDLDGIQILCKNFRLLIFTFGECSGSKKRKLVLAIMRFAFPSREDLSFGYYYNEEYCQLKKLDVNMYNNRKDWSDELKRCGASKWQVMSSASIKCDISLPLYIVIPRCDNVEKYIENMASFNDYRSAFWVYEYKSASLVRMAELKPNILNTKTENITLELVRKCNPKKMLEIMRLWELLPNLNDVNRAYAKLKKLCCPGSTQKFIDQDAKFYSLLDKSCWLFYVSSCLKNGKYAANCLRNGTTVVLRENNARDMCCIISSLCQIMVDPYFRTIEGFQSLIQKEWVSLEHPFLERLGNVIKAESMEQCPLFLLFLDCVWQLMHQFPEDFEFSGIYLRTLWDSAFIPVFDTFQFNNEKERKEATMKSNIILRPVWDWSAQFPQLQTFFFSNPFYFKKAQVEQITMVSSSAVLLPGLQNKSKSSSKEMNQEYFIEPICCASDLEIWRQCYYRWTPILEIENGGFRQMELFHRQLLQHKVELNMQQINCATKRKSITEVVKI